MDKTKALDKIQKCLRLSKSANANEAAAALRQAQALMKKFGLSEEDIALAGYGEEAVDVPIQFNKKKVPVVLACLVGLMERAFGVQPVISARVGVSDLSYRIRYFGPKHRIAMAGYAHVVVYRAMEAEWRKFLKERPHLRGQRDARTSFQLGWLGEVEGKVAEVGFTEEEREAVDALMTTTFGKQLKTSTTNGANVYGSIAAAGKRAAGDFNLSRPMGQERARLEKL